MNAFDIMLLTGGGGPGNVTNPTNTAYVPWNLDYLYDAIPTLWGNIGMAFNIGIWIFIIMTGLYLLIKIVSSIGK